jgi:hypothetical protein
MARGTRPTPLFSLKGKALGTPESKTVSPNGKHAYVVAAGSDGVAIVARERWRVGGHSRAFDSTAKFGNAFL